MSISSFSRRDGSLARTRSGPPGFTATRWRSSWVSLQGVYDAKAEGFLERAWTGCRNLGAGKPCRTQAAKARRYDGIHVRKPLRFSAHALRQRVLRIAT